ncbi:MAG: uroporphyrinogen decarboxylase family protein [Kiritimatiellae bacterium]|nr:uroporphyrinogen decarboxylase family protein [Kiritimatiellia bacterium]
MPACYSTCRALTRLTGAAEWPWRIRESGSDARIREAFLDSIPRHVRLDLAFCWEDICYNAGPIISPDAFRKVVLPRMQRVTARLREQLGCRYVGVDCDGNFLALLDGWIEAGVNVLSPCEVDAGMHVLKLQAQYGDRCCFFGGIQKKALIESPAAIDAELHRVLPAVCRGGYIPHLDHSCPANVPFENYKYYVRRKREVLGCVAVGQ